MKAIIIKDHLGTTLYVAKVSEIGELDFLNAKKEAEKNQVAFVESIFKEINGLNNQIETLKHEIKILKGEE